MPRILTLFIIISVSHLLYAANPAKSLITKTTPDGTIVMARADKMPATSMSSTRKAMEYDITFTTFEDSIYIISSISTERPLATADSALIVANKASFTVPIEKIFVEHDAKMWISRLRIALSTEDFNTLILQEDAPEFTWGSIGDSPRFRHTNKKWKDCRAVYRMAIDIINQNK